MKCGIYMYWSRNAFRIYVPVRYKMTFYISSVSLICMAVLSAVCIVKSRNDSLNLMAERLAQFASIRASQIERDLTDQASLLNFAMQGRKITNVVMDLYFGNVTAQSWATSVKDVVDDMFTTSIRTYEAFLLYDASENLVFSMANPYEPIDIIEELIPALPGMLPLGNKMDGQNVTLPYSKNASRASNLVINAAASAAVFAANNATSTSTQRTGRSKNLLAHRPLSFSKTSDNVSVWLSQPVPLVNSSGTIDGYSYSLSVPVSYTTVVNKTQTSRLIGYCTALLDCSHYMNYTAVDDMSDLHEMDFMKKAMISVVGVTNSSWHFLFPTGSNSTANTKLHPYSTFPAISNAVYLQKHVHTNNGHKPGGAVMKTTTPHFKKASVGYSYVQALNNNWYLAVELPRSQAEEPIWRLTKLLLAVAICLLVLVTAAAYLLSSMATFPLFHIYRAMNLRCRDEKTDPEGGHKPVRKIRDLLLITPAFRRPGHLVRSSSTCTSSSSQSQYSGETSTPYTKDPTSKCSEPRTPDTTTASLSPSTTYSIGRSLYSNESHPADDTSAQKTLKEIINNTKTNESKLRVPSKIPVLNRLITDEFDDLVIEYNNMVDRLTMQYTKMEDEVRERTREAQESKERAEAANLTKTKFLMNISHELITPMNGIIGIAAVTEDETDIEQAKNGLNTIIESGKLLQELLQGILNYNSYLSGVESKTERFILGTLMEGLKKRFQSASINNGVTLDISCCPPQLANCNFEGAIMPITHICMGLVSNAIKFSDPKKLGSIVRPSPNVTIQAYLRRSDKLIDGFEGANSVTGEGVLNNSMLEVVIADTGVGIEKERLAHIFDEFVQGDDALSKRFTGTGLGLALSKLLCDHIGGYIAVHSGQEVGCTVILRVPVKNISGFKLDSVPRQKRVELNNSLPAWWTDSKRRRIFLEVPLGKEVAAEEPTGTLALNAMVRRGSGTDPGLAVGTESSVDVSRASDPEASVSGSSVKLVESSLTSQQMSTSLRNLLTSSSRLPREREQVGEHNTSRSIPEPVLSDKLSRLQVLVADDNEIMRDILRRMLHRLGVRYIDVAEDGPTVVKLVEKAIISGIQYSIIFMDLSMPETDGIKATQDIRRQLGYFCPVVALTGYSDAEMLQECVDAGLQRVLTKPVEQHQLLDVLSHIVLDSQK